MQMPPQSKRKCEECLNSIPLNHFRLNSSTCRYCQDGLIVPSMLKETTTDIESIVKVKPITNTMQEEDINDGNSTLDEIDADNHQSRSSDESNLQ